MPLNTTNKVAYQHYKSSLLLPSPEKNYDKGTRIISLISMSAVHTDKIILIFCEYKTIAKKTSLSGKFRYCN